MIPNKGPNKAAIESTIAKIPIWLKKVSQKTPTANPNIAIMILELLRDKDEGAKFIKEY